MVRAFVSCSAGAGDAAGAVGLAEDAVALALVTPLGRCCFL